MAKKVVLDAGHGMHTAGKRTPAGEREWSFNDKVVKAAIAELKNYPDISVKRSDDPTGKTDVSLARRVKVANDWKADVFISVHHNASTGRWGNWGGTETYFYPNSTKGKLLAQAVHKPMVKAYKLKDRGLKTAKYYVIKNVKAPAILVEGGFMDSNIDIKAMRNDAVLKAVGISIAQGIAAYLGVSRKVVAAKPAAKPTSKPAATGTYTVKAGDTLWGISNSTGVSVKDLKSINGLKSDVIHAGDKLSLAAKPKAKRLKVITDSLWYYGSADWKDKVATVKKGDVFTIDKEVTVAGSKMYKLVSGTYITANPKYVKII